MKKILTSKWFAVGAGLVLFVITMVVVMKLQAAKSPDTTEKTAANTPTNAPTEGALTNHHSVLDETVTNPVVKPVFEDIVPENQVGEPGSLTFNNPEVAKLIEELRQEKTALQQRESLLNELARRVKLELANLSEITQTVWKAKAQLEHSLTNEMNIRIKSEETNLVIIAKAYTNMAPANAVTILKAMNIELIAKILILMQEKERAAILESFSTNAATAGMASEISDKIRTIVLPPKMTK
jgi:flagellar motility protein MotE (MotC chaperone)